MLCRQTRLSGGAQPTDCSAPPTCSLLVTKGDEEARTSSTTAVLWTCSSGKREPSQRAARTRDPPLQFLHAMHARAARNRANGRCRGARLAEGRARHAPEHGSSCAGQVSRVSIAAAVLKRGAFDRQDPVALRLAQLVPAQGRDPAPVCAPFAARRCAA